MTPGDTIAAKLARFAARLRYDDIPDAVSHAASRYLADTLACAIAAAAEPDAPAIDIVRDYARRGTREEATVIGTDWKTDLRSAALANCTMARYIDANDIYMPVSGGMSGSGHFSDAIPAIVSAAEASGASGQELLAAIVLAYEVQAALADAYAWLDRGFHSVSQVTPATALAAGKLLGLNEEQLLHAASLAITSGLLLQSWLKPAASVSAIKGGAPGLAAERGILCAELASQGFTGPPDAFETLFERFPAANPEPFDRLGNEWMTSRNAIKPVPAQIFTQAVIQCAEDLYRDGLRLADLDSLKVRSNEGACGRVQGSPEAFRPETREAADHSTPFVTAITLRDGQLTAGSYDGEPWRDPALLESMGRMTLVIDPVWDQRMREDGSLGAAIEARDRIGRQYRAEVPQFRGHPDNPLSDDDLQRKLIGLLDRERVLGSGSGERLLKVCRELPGEHDPGRLVSLWTIRGV